MFWIANRHSWYVSQLIPMRNSYFFENSNTETFSVSYYLTNGSLKIEGGSFDTLVVYKFVTLS